MAWAAELKEKDEIFDILTQESGVGQRVNLRQLCSPTSFSQACDSKQGQFEAVRSWKNGATT